MPLVRRMLVLLESLQLLLCLSWSLFSDAVAIWCVDPSLPLHVFGTANACERLAHSVFTHSNNLRFMSSLHSMMHDSGSSRYVYISRTSCCSTGSMVPRYVEKQPCSIYLSHPCCPPSTQQMFVVLNFTSSLAWFGFDWLILYSLQGLFVVVVEVEPIAVLE
jgi:hypothetical protein